jgi:hypothetical protein
MMKPLPSGPWEALFPRAILLIDEIERYVTPRLSDTAASLTEEYTEMPSSFVKLQFEEGEIDFVAAPNLTDGAWEPRGIQGRAVRVETAAEVVAKKMFHRGDRPGNGARSIRSRDGHRARA